MMTSSKTPWPERIWRSQYGLDVARGDVAESKVVSTFGEYASDGPMNMQPVWETTLGSTFVVPDRVQLSVTSTSGLDTGEIVIQYLDGDLTEQVEVLALTGTTPALTQATDVRAIENVYHRGGPVVGDILLSSGGVNYAKISAGTNKFNTSFYRVPAGKRLVIHAIFGGSVSANADSRVLLRAVTTQTILDSFADEGILYSVAAIGVQDSSTTLPLTHPLTVNEGEWFGFIANSSKAADVTAGLFGWIEQIR